jgi:hypothetical protein
MIDSDNFGAGSVFVFEVILIALSLSLGILASRIVPPIDNHLKPSRIQSTRKARMTKYVQKAKARIQQQRDISRKVNLCHPNLESYKSNSETAKIVSGTPSKAESLKFINLLDST